MLIRQLPPFQITELLIYFAPMLGVDNWRRRGINP